MSDAPKSRYSLEQITNWVVLTKHLTGEEPKVIELTPDFYTFFVQEVNRMADILGLDLGFKDGKATYNHIPVEKKVIIETVK